MLKGAISTRTHLISLVYLICTTALFAWSDRSNFPVLISLFTESFVAYLILLHQKNTQISYLALVAVLAHIPAFFFMPNLSPDSYRFLWDGALTLSGENPLDTIPRELMSSEPYASSFYYKELYQNITDLSKNNFTCYPTVNQFYFAIANLFSNNVSVNLFVLKFLIFCTQALGLLYLWRLLKLLKINVKRVFIVALNPLWLTETVGNLHFEGVMLSFLIMALYFLVKKQWFWAAILFAGAVHIKLIPIVLLPFLLRYLGWRRSFLFYGITGGLIFGLSLVYMRPDNYQNFLDSLQLYFSSFEFNSLIYHNYMEYGRSLYGFYPTEKYEFDLPGIAALLMLCIAFYGGRYSFKVMATRMIFGLLIYYLFATTVHPWYVLTILGLSVFTNYSFGIIWSGLIFLTYASYGAFDKETLRLIIHIEYAVLLVATTIEIFFRRPIIPALR